jgi:hypothetical protein
MQKRYLKRTYHEVPKFRLILLRFCVHTIPNINGFVFVAFPLTFWTSHGELASAWSARNSAQDTEMGAMSVSSGHLGHIYRPLLTGPKGHAAVYAKPRPHRVQYGAEGRSGSNWRSEPGIVGSRGRSRSGFPAPRGSERASKNYHCKALSPFSEISRVHGICVCTVQSCPRSRMRKQFWTGVIVYPPFPKPYDVQGTIRSEIGILILPSAMAAEFERCALKARLYYRLLNLYKCRSVVIVLIPVRTVELPV